MTQPQWYLVQCKPRHTFRAEEHLTNQGFECFLPAHRIKRKHRDTFRLVTEPLFPHYLFIRLDDASNWSVIRSTRGVMQVVRFNGEAKPVSEAIIEGLKQHCAILSGVEPEPLFRAGDRVVITQGAFRELEAVVHATKGEERVVLLLNLLNQPQYLEVPTHTLSRSD